MKKTTGLLLTLTIALLSLSLAGCGNSASSTSKDSEEPKFVNGKLTKEFELKTPTFTGFNEFIIADLKGFFKEVNIKPVYTGVLAQGSNLAQSVVRGDNDLFGSGHPTNIAVARKAGAKIKIVLHSMVDSPENNKLHMTWLVKDGGKINSPADLVGKKIAVGNLGGCVDLLNSEFLKQNNIPKDKVEVVVMKDELQEQALRQGIIDVAVVHPPYNVKAENAGGVKVLTTSFDIGTKAGDGTIGGLAVRAFSEDFIKKHPDVVKAYIVADLKAQQWINDHYEEALKLEAEYLKIDPKDMAGNIYPNQWWVKPEQVQWWIDTAYKNKLAGFENPGEIKAEDLFTNDLNPYYTKELAIPANK
ncbi:ABC transporter substrate-binding protein [Paenibacillus durus]|uniref:ABC transporter substrate-binding protein n=1 Tax=Paenibacillus durus TaxID=44251 RepID=UPI0004721DCB|nr:ABC transporter substrate-binding protein [Paenibacillus durus]